MEIEVNRGTSRTRTSSGSSCVSNITLCVVLLFALLTCVIGIAWLVMNPREPSIRVCSSVSHFSLSDSQLRGTYDIGFNISNPNKKIDVFLDKFNVLLSYQKVELAWGTVQVPISLERTRETNVKVRMVMEVGSGELGKKQVFAEVQDKWRRKMTVSFSVRMNVRVRLEAGNWPPKSKLLNLNCGYLLVFRGHEDAGKFLGYAETGENLRPHPDSAQLFVKL
ncbi:uncharacterized protein LOC129313221 [Prosopis cineraria]|uniref:uncharacterized protein LOC129313221 n=1 Tax=Prosopis cineraria TaxID=364024 RepID=UPI00241074DE|nr:uncharacterized protein LOC129313221 [Prosopis cineraria]